MICSTSTLCTSYNVILGIGSFLYVIYGIPQLVFLIRKKKTEGIALSSFWILYTASIFYAALGFFTANDLLVYSELIAAIIFGVQMFLIVKYLPKEALNKLKRHLAYLFIILYIIIDLVLAILNAVKVLGTDQEISNDSVIITGEVAANIAPILSTIAFLPQVIKGIKTKSLFKQPFSFVFLTFFSGLIWIFAWSLAIAWYSVFNRNLVNTYIINLVYQFISNIITGTQFSVWLHQSLKTKQFHWI